MDTRREILDAARALYLAGGPRAVTMRAIAKRVGVTATALYRHFESKDALLQEVIDEGLRLFASYLYRALEGPDARTRLRLSGMAYLEFGLEHPAFYRTIFMSDQPRGARESQTSATFQFLMDRVDECIEAGILEPASPEDLAITIWAHTHGLLSLYISTGLPMAENEFRSRYAKSLGLMIKGIGA